jgi:hypothetical protein
MDRHVCQSGEIAMPGSRYLETPGLYRGQVIDWSVFESGKDGSQAVMINVRFRVLEQYAPGNAEYEEYLQDGWFAFTNCDASWQDVQIEGRYAVVKRDGTPNTDTVSMLAEHLGWDGSFVGVNSGTVPDVKLQVVVKVDDRNDKYMRAEWLRPWDSVPSGGNLDQLEPTVLQALDSKHGSTMRAVCASAKGERTAPDGAPPVPAKETTPEEVPF